ncbi:hypothetical protein B10263_17270 [Campylobacter jejuni]|nr:hypothetical protein THJ060_15550 [Campylobacter jejuni]GKY57408.1 hypothetical protein THJ085_16900 [Campylobacter jejuni]GML43370.1 hypothetical protein B10263_17270 [Campylobacter jejuni]
MENRDFKKTIDLNVMTSKFLNLLNSIILNKVNQKLKFLNFYFKNSKQKVLLIEIEIMI